jgi:hypothetical protein
METNLKVEPNGPFLLTVEDLLEHLRQKGDVHIICNQESAPDDVYRVTISWWPGQGNQLERRVHGAELFPTLAAALKAYELGKAEMEGY